MIPDRPPPTVIEQTGKRWKALQLAGAAMSFFGAAWLGHVGFALEATQISKLGMGIFSAGILLILMARTGAWWYHG